MRVIWVVWVDKPKVRITGRPSVKISTVNPVVAHAVTVLPTIGGVLVGVGVYLLIASASAGAAACLVIGLVLAGTGMALRKRLDPLRDPRPHQNPDG